MHQLPALVRVPTNHLFKPQSKLAKLKPNRYGHEFLRRVGEESWFVKTRTTE